MKPKVDPLAPPPPLLHVSTLGQFEYCPRAGIIAFERQRQDRPDIEDIPPDMSFTPPFEVDRLRKAIADKRAQLGGPICLAAGVLLFIFLTGQTLGLSFAAPFAIALVPIYWHIHPNWRELQLLQAELRRYLAAKPQRLEDGPRTRVAVEWWELTKVYQLIQANEKLLDRELQIIGAPFRMIGFHADWLPVILSGSAEESISSGQLLRLTAYAYLLRKQRRNCAWGVVIFRHNRKGFAIPLDEPMNHDLAQKLAQLRSAIELTQLGADVEKGHPNACARCPLGRPRTYLPGKSETMIGNTRLAPFLSANNGHSDCGDRYRWQPPYVG